MTKTRYPLLVVLMLAVCALFLTCGAFAEEAEELPQPWSYSVTYVEHDNAYTASSDATGWSVQFAVEDHHGALPEGQVFQGWAVTPTGSAQYEPGGKLTLMSGNNHATLYAVYGKEGVTPNEFKVVYKVGDHQRTETYFSTRKTYKVKLAEPYTIGTGTWWKGEDGQTYIPGDSFVLQAGQTHTFTADLEDAPNFMFRVNYVLGDETITAMIFPEEKTSSPICYPTVGDGLSSKNLMNVLGFSAAPDGNINYPLGTRLCMQFNVPEITLYAIYKEGTKPQPEYRITLFVSDTGYQVKLGGYTMQDSRLGTYLDSNTTIGEISRTQVVTPGETITLPQTIAKADGSDPIELSRCTVTVSGIGQVKDSFVMPERNVTVRVTLPSQSIQPVDLATPGDMNSWTPDVPGTDDPAPGEGEDEGNQGSDIYYTVVPISQPGNPFNPGTNPIYVSPILQPITGQPVTDQPIAQPIKVTVAQVIEGVPAKKPTAEQYTAVSNLLAQVGALPGGQSVGSMKYSLTVIVGDDAGWYEMSAIMTSDGRQVSTHDFKQTPTIRIPAGYRIKLSWDTAGTRYYVTDVESRTSFAVEKGSWIESFTMPASNLTITLGAEPGYNLTLTFDEDAEYAGNSQIKKPDGEVYTRNFQETSTIKVVPGAVVTLDSENGTPFYVEWRRGNTDSVLGGDVITSFTMPDNDLHLHLRNSRANLQIYMADPEATAKISDGDGEYVVRHGDVLKVHANDFVEFVELPEGCAASATVRGVLISVEDNGFTMLGFDTTLIIAPPHQKGEPVITVNAEPGAPDVMIPFVYVDAQGNKETIQVGKTYPITAAEGEMQLELIPGQPMPKLLITPYSWFDDQGNLNAIGQSINITLLSETAESRDDSNTYTLTIFPTVTAEVDPVTVRIHNDFHEISEPAVFSVTPFTAVMFESGYTVTHLTSMEGIASPALFTMPSHDVSVTVALDYSSENDIPIKWNLDNLPVDLTPLDPVKVGFSGFVTLTPLEPVRSCGCRPSCDCGCWAGDPCPLCMGIDWGQCWGCDWVNGPH